MSKHIHFHRHNLEPMHAHEHEHKPGLIERLRHFIDGSSTRDSSGADYHPHSHMVRPSKEVSA